jgi:integrase
VLFNPIDRDEHVPEPVRTRVRFLSESEAERIMVATPDRFQAMVALGLFAGLRIGEVLHLRPPPFDVDLELGVLFVQGRDGWTPKGRLNRELPISSALEPYLERHVEEFAGETYMLVGRDGRSTYDKRSLGRRFDRIVADAGLTAGIADPMGVTFHTLRHTFASWLVMSGVDLLTVARLMGHSTIKQVQETYGHLSPEHRRAAVELLSERWFERTTLGRPASEPERSAGQPDEPEAPSETQTAPISSHSYR